MRETHEWHIERDLACYSDKIDVQLYKDVIQFIASTTKADKERSVFDQHRLPIDMLCQAGDFQAKYNLAYLGELLERHESISRSLEVFRAILLALAVTREIIEQTMYQNAQWKGFMRKAESLASADHYIASALMLIEQKEHKDKKYETVILNSDFRNTEDLMFAVGLYRDRLRAYEIFKEHIIEKLGKGRTISVYGNSYLWGWFAGVFSEQVRADRKKDAAFLKALLACTNSNILVKNKHYNELLTHGFTHEELAYLNAAMLDIRWNGVREVYHDSVIREKAAVEHCAAVIGASTCPPEPAIRLMNFFLACYVSFPRRFDDLGNIYHALHSRDIRVQNVDVFLAIKCYGQKSSKQFLDFDICDPRWDKLASVLGENAYAILVMDSLEEMEDIAKVNQWIQRYHQITQKTILRCFEIHSVYSRLFKFFVENGYFDLWSLFAYYLPMLPGSERISKEDERYKRVQAAYEAAQTILGYIWDYFTEFHQKGYEFFRILTQKYSTKQLVEIFGDDKPKELFRQFIKRDYTTSSQNGSRHEMEICFELDMLPLDAQQYIFGWLEDYAYHHNSEKYVSFVVGILRSDIIERLFNKEMGRALFDTLLELKPDKIHYYRNALRDKYYTQEELDRIKAEKEAKAQKAKEEEITGRQNKLRRLFDEICLSKWHTALNLWEKADDEDLASRLLLAFLHDSLVFADVAVTDASFSDFIALITKMLRKGIITLEDYQGYILNVKEDIKIGTDIEPDADAAVAGKIQPAEKMAA